MWSGLVYGAVACGVVGYGMLRCSVVRLDMVWHGGGEVWCGVWYLIMWCFQHAGNMGQAAYWQNYARELDTADRFLNCKVPSSRSSVYWLHSMPPPITHFIHSVQWYTLLMDTLLCGTLC